MISKYRAWHKTWEEMGRITFIRYKKSGEIFHLSFRRNIYNRNIYGGLVKLDEIELMQSTGLKDKNDKEIFEGDILEIQGIRMVVKFGSYEYIESSKSNGHTLGVVYDGLGFYVECINAADPDRISPFEPKTLKESYVIGNRFETPELLEDKE